MSLKTSLLILAHILVPIAFSWVFQNRPMIICIAVLAAGTSLGIYSWTLISAYPWFVKTLFVMTYTGIIGLIGLFGTHNWGPNPVIRIESTNQLDTDVPFSSPIRITNDGPMPINDVSLLVQIERFQLGGIQAGNNTIGLDRI